MTERVEVDDGEVWVERVEGDFVTQVDPGYRLGVRVGEGDGDFVYHLLTEDEGLKLAEALVQHLADAKPPDLPKPFILLRMDDETGVSGTGTVAWGVEFPDGKAVTRWKGDATSVRQTCVWDNVKHVEQVHGHGGKTLLVYIDPRIPPGVALMSTPPRRP